MVRAAIGRESQMDKVKVLFFGPLADSSGAKEVYIKLNGTSMLSQIKDLLDKKYLKSSNIPYMMAVNMEQVRDNIQIKEGDEIAVMPPFSGG